MFSMHMWRVEKDPMTAKRVDPLETIPARNPGASPARNAPRG
jgi:hypothetical protein